MEKIELKIKSQNEWENTAIRALMNQIIADESINIPVKIFKIPESNAKSPDFYTTGFSSIIEIKRVTEDDEQMKTIGSTTNLFEKIQADVQKKIEKTAFSIHISINVNSALKNRGSEYISLINKLSEDVNNGKNHGFSGNCFYKIMRGGGNSSNQPSVYVSFNQMQHTSAELLQHNIKPLLESAAKQLLNYKNNSLISSIKIILLDHYYTATPLPQTIIEAVKLASSQLKKELNAIDRIYFRMNDTIGRINVEK